MKGTYFTKENFPRYIFSCKGTGSGRSPPLRFCYLSKIGMCWNQMSLDLQNSLLSLHILSIIWHNKPEAKQAFEENSSPILRVLINRLSIKARSIYAKNIMSVLIQVTITCSWKTIHPSSAWPFSFSLYPRRIWCLWAISQFFSLM